MRLVRWCVRAGLRQDWRGLAMLTLITALMGAVALAAVAGARRTDTAVARFLQYAGPFQGQVAADPPVLEKIAALPGLAYTQLTAYLLVRPVAVDGRPLTALGAGAVSTLAAVDNPPQVRSILLAGRYPGAARADEVMVSESAARELDLHVGSVLRMAGYRPDQTEQVMNGAGFALPPDVQAGDVRVTGIIRLPTDLTDDLDAPADVTYTGQGEIITTAAFYQRYGAALGGFPGLAFQLTGGPAGLPAFAAQVKRLADSAQFELGDDNAAAGSFAQRGTSLQALALLLFGVILVGLPLGIVAGRWAWLLFADQAAIMPAPVVSALTLLVFPAVLLLANAIAAIPARTAARTQPAVVLRTE